MATVSQRRTLLNKTAISRGSMAKMNGVMMAIPIASPIYQFDNSRRLAGWEKTIRAN